MPLAKTFQMKYGVQTNGLRSAGIARYVLRTAYGVATANIHESQEKGENYVGLSRVGVLTAPIGAGVS